MVKQGWTPKIMFEKADEFFQSMGLEPMTKVRRNMLLNLPKFQIIFFFADFLGEERDREASRREGTGLPRFRMGLLPAKVLYSRNPITL